MFVCQHVTTHRRIVLGSVGKMRLISQLERPLISQSAFCTFEHVFISLRLLQVKLDGGRAIPWSDLRRRVAGLSEHILCRKRTDAISRYGELWRYVYAMSEGVG